MPYVSDELTHFVGRSLRTPDEQFNLLCSIIHDGVLLDPSHAGRQDPILTVDLGSPNSPNHDQIEYWTDPNVRHDMSVNFSGNGLVQFEIVCFCDIPLADLHVHAAKYSCFGIAFTKDFAVEHGASPVMYVPLVGNFSMTLRDRLVSTGEQHSFKTVTRTRSGMFDQLWSVWYRSIVASYKQYDRELNNARNERRYGDVDRILSEMYASLFYVTALEANVYGHLKFWDSTLPPTHRDNYYMEREWRVSGRIHFELSDIQRILVPPDYAQRVIERLPELSSRITPISVD